MNTPIKPTVVPEILPLLASIVGAPNVLSDPADCWPYGYDNSRRHSQPDVVVLPNSHDQIQQIIRLCYQHEIPVVARGRGTNTTGACIPLRRGMVISCERMSRLIDLDAANRTARVEPGITNRELQNAAGQKGFFWPPDPSSAAYCTIGGNLAVNAAGPRAIKYGTVRDNVLGLHAVTGMGETIHTGVYTTKGVVGYDLTRLIIGSEGTLAIITEATLKLTPLPQRKCTLQAIYRDIGAASEAVTRIMAQPVIPCALEFIDGNAIAMIRDHCNVTLPDAAGALLLIEVDGQTSCLDDALSAVSSAAHGPGLVSIKSARTQHEADALWAARNALSPALRTIAPKKINEDVVVPVSKIPQLIEGLTTLAHDFAIKIINFGHAGNGNIHVNLLIDPDDPDQAARATACLDKIFNLVLELNGTLSGEHGVGIEKRDFIDREIDATTLQLMRDIKRLFDPRDILNPGKIFPIKATKEP